MSGADKKRPARALLGAGAGIIAGLSLSGCCWNCFSPTHNYDLSDTGPDLSAPDLAEEPDAATPPDGGLTDGSATD